MRKIGSNNGGAGNAPPAGEADEGGPGLVEFGEVEQGDRRPAAVPLARVRATLRY